MDDGIVRVEFWFEKEAPEVKTVIHKHYDEYHYGYPYRRLWWGDVYAGSPTYSSNSPTTSADISNVKLGNISAEVKKHGAMRGMTSNASASLTSTAGSLSDFATAQNVAQTNPLTDSYFAEVNEAGITVPGSKVQQSFTTVYGFNAEGQSNVIVIRLAGKVGEVEVAAPVTVKAKQKCETCGKVNKATSKFCTDCGTALELL
jgi:hypothetical protein